MNSCTLEEGRSKVGGYHENCDSERYNMDATRFESFPSLVFADSSFAEPIAIQSRRWVREPIRVRVARTVLFIISKECDNATKEWHSREVGSARIDDKFPNNLRDGFQERICPKDTPVVGHGDGSFQQTRSEQVLLRRFLKPWNWQKMNKSWFELGWGGSECPRCKAVNLIERAVQVPIEIWLWAK